MSNTNTYLAQQAAVLESPIAYTLAAGNMVTAQASVQSLIDLISLEGTDPDVKRLFLDEMSPVARVSLFKTLTDLKASLTAA